MLLPDDPKDLKTKYKFKKSDLTWTKNFLESVDYFRLWTTSDATYLVVEENKSVAVLSYNTDFISSKTVVDNIAKVKKSVEKLGWNFGYDKTLGLTMNMNSDVEKHAFITKRFNKHFKNLGAKKDLIDVDKAVKEAADFFIRTNVLGETITDPKFF